MVFRGVPDLRIALSLRHFQRRGDGGTAGLAGITADEKIGPVRDGSEELIDQFRMDGFKAVGIALLRSVQEKEGPDMGGGFQFPPCGKTEDIPGIGIRDLADHGPDGTDEDMDHFSTRPLTAMICMFISVLISVATSLSQI